MKNQAVQTAKEPVQKSATMIFAAYNEAASVADKVNNLREIRAITPDVRFSAYVDKSSDGSLDMWLEHGDILQVTAATERTGKAVGMGRLVAQSDSDVIICTDANVRIAPEAVQRLLEYFEDPQVGGVCGRLIYTNPDDSSMALTNSTYWRIEEAIKFEEGRSGSTMGADGSFFAVRRSLYPEVPSHLLDDFIVSMSVVFQDKRLISAPDVLAYEPTAADGGEEMRRKRRIACRAYASHLYVSKAVSRMSLKNKYKYYAHRWLRWHSTLTLFLSWTFFTLFVATVLGIAYAAVLIGLSAVGLLLCLKGPSPSAMIGDILRSFYATQLGVFDALKGKRYQTWDPPMGARKASDSA